ncbi:MAG: hypothetical protein O6920_06180 [Chloroflexi bacterium]|nr:hypothetical protein [Chloroflexota bacterium]
MAYVLSIPSQPTLLPSLNGARLGVQQFVASELYEIWEPWRPLPGSRVRVRNCTECPTNHHDWEYGCAGVITEIPGDTFMMQGLRQDIEDRYSELLGHYYQVEYDIEAPTGSHGALYAAIEIELINY